MKNETHLMTSLIIHMFLNKEIKIFFLIKYYSVKQFLVIHIFIVLDIIFTRINMACCRTIKNSLQRTCLLEVYKNSKNTINS